MITVLVAVALLLFAGVVVGLAGRAPRPSRRPNHGVHRTRVVLHPTPHHH